MIIARGRSEAWLKLPVAALKPWADLNDVTFNAITVGPLPGFEQRGSTVIAAEDLSAGNAEPLMIIPRDLVLSQEAVRLHAKSDQHLREVLDALAEFGRVSSPVIVAFSCSIVQPPLAVDTVLSIRQSAPVKTTMHSNPHAEEERMLPSNHEDTRGVNHHIWITAPIPNVDRFDVACYLASPNALLSTRAVAARPNPDGMLAFAVRCQSVWGGQLYRSTAQSCPDLMPRLHQPRCP